MMPSFIAFSSTSIKTSPAKFKWEVARVVACCTVPVIHASRSTLDESYQSRLSFCCAEEGCRRRTTPPSVRFLGRRVYLGVIVVLISALAHGLSAKRRQWLIDALGVPAPTLWRWQHWWREVFAQEPWWRLEHAQFVPPLTALQLPGELLDRLRGADLRERVVRLLWLIAPQSTTAWSGCLRLMAHPQNL